MQPLSVRAHVAALSVLALGASASNVRALVGASGGAGPSADTSALIQGGQNNGAVSISEDVSLDPAAGPWRKNLVNNANSRSSGEDVAIVETLTNVGNITWTDWHEHVVSTTDFGGGITGPGFLFRNDSLSLQANYGAGFVNLTQGVDYTVVPTLYSGPSSPPPMTNDGQWQAIDIFFSPARAIKPSDVLRINKSIFEVFLDGDPWRPQETAIIAEYPTPEPAGLTIFGAVAALAVVRRRPRPV
ncbi:MAG TPA: hypothetical protein VH518_21655 [Tepidisphaeraceae bacterium]|jgi:hypothetical protein